MNPWLRLLLGALPTAALAAGPVGAPSEEAVDARARIAEGVYLESGMGDLRGAATTYEAVLASPDGVPPETLAEARFRLGLAWERLADPERAESAYRNLLEQHPGTRWAGDAELRLRSLEEDRNQIEDLPATFGFERTFGGLFHARNRAHKGRLALEATDDGRAVVAWRTHVSGGEDDLVALGFSPSVTVHGELRAVVKAGDFPAHLTFFLVDATGARWGTTTRVVRPEEGWVTLELRAGDFRRRAGTGGTFSPQAGIPFLMIQDVTGHSSTDRGENVLFLDELSIR